VRARLTTFLFLLVLLLFLPLDVFADEDWTIQNFESEILINNNGTISVNERITVNFDVEKHGIYREIPYVYEDSDSQKTYTKIDKIAVSQDGRNAITSVTDENGYIKIRIGDPNNTIAGNHAYELNYLVTGVLKSYDTYDELYWNVTGNGWEVPILKSSAVVIESKNGTTNSSCFQGYIGSTEPCSIKNNRFEATRMLSASEGLTITTAFKKGAFPIIAVERPKSFIEKLLEPLSIISFVSILSSGILGFIFLWMKKGRDFWNPGITGYKSKNLTSLIKPLGAYEPEIIEFTPPEDLPPAIVGVIVDERADTLDITSTIIDLATRGYLKIDEIPKAWLFGGVDYILRKSSKPWEKLFPYEKELLKRLFTSDEVKISELKKTFYEDLAEVKKKLYQDAVDKRYFPEDPEKIRNRYLIIAIFLIVLSGFGIIYATGSEIVFLTVVLFALICLGLLLLIFSRIMPRRTSLGREIYRRIKGYELFIEKAEKYRQKFFESRNLFNEVLPYTIVFGLTKKYAKAMEKIGYKPQNSAWYSGSNNLNLVNFSNNISSFSKSVSTAIASSPKSSGFSGGSSGGGFGGGGGGSW